MKMALSRKIYWNMNENLKLLYKRIDNCQLCKARGNSLQHIHGFGVTYPKFMLILINPTYRNLSSAPQYRGQRFPFIGVRQFWKVLSRGGLIDKQIALELPSRSGWSKNHTETIKNQLVENELFLTNIVKCCYNHANYPGQDVFESHLESLKEEIRLVKPKKIIAFDALVFEILTGRKIVLHDYWRGKEKVTMHREIVSGLDIQTIPCYFPVGRGKPKAAIRVLRRLIKT